MRKTIATDYTEKHRRQVLAAGRAACVDRGNEPGCVRLSQVMQIEVECNCKGSGIKAE
ncbi:hypothetical protein SAMN04487894_102315 [Niabella drilacis]|uniref:Uncharacterized protein n=1 Tax=Niabella drilacis (strain DSM 25811 / CCM 8410 / CCUG 62505 / LMG 26954 / E90) TaxID=1285928 RepID=A0A1G6LDT9_NIADE|nr:hypothetical protein SAMN04487894_102315 [Niabella drilacis]